MVRGVRWCGVGAALVLLVAARFAPAAPAVALTSLGNQLVRFDTRTPGVLGSLVPISGLAGGAGEIVQAIDQRPRSGELYALGVVNLGATDSLRLYRIDADSGVAVAVGAASIDGMAAGNYYGMDFNPAVDRIRVVNDADANLRIHPDTGLRADVPINDILLAPAGRLVGDLSYDRDVGSGGTSTVYAIARATGQLVTIGGVNGVPSPNGGVVTAVGALGLTLAAGKGAGFDIGRDGVGYALLTDGASGKTGAYTIDLGSAAATPVGLLGSGTLAVRGMTTIAPPSRAVALVGNQLWRFAATHPDVIDATSTISGLQGGAGERLVGIDFRPRRAACTRSVASMPARPIPCGCIGSNLAAASRARSARRSRVFRPARSTAWISTLRLTACA